MLLITSGSLKITIILQIMNLGGIQLYDNGKALVCNDTCIITNLLFLYNGD